MVPRSDEDEAMTPEQTRRKSMHQTTLRFGPELWSRLERAASRGSVSIAQYVREAALERLARARPSDDDAANPDEATVAGLDAELERDPYLARARQAEDTAGESITQQQNTAALMAQNHLVRKRALELREQAIRLRRGGPS